MFLSDYLSELYQSTMRRAYEAAIDQACEVLKSGGACLDCGAGEGQWFGQIAAKTTIDCRQYYGIEWSAGEVSRAAAKGLQVVQGDLNQPLPYPNESFRCVFAFSVLEHLLNGCRFLRECHRVLAPGGTLILLTPNISTYFTVANLLLGRMPSTGPHPDSSELLSLQRPSSPSTLEKVDIESETPAHRHLVVFSFKALRSYLRIVGFSQVRGRGFGLYPLPQWLQPIAERFDPYHCHQMVFVAKR